MAEHITMTDEPSIHTGRYRHYKGNEYTVIGTARHSETLEELVVYRQEYGDHGLWVRPIKMFLESVEVDGEVVSRFQRITVPKKMPSARDVLLGDREPFPEWLSTANEFRPEDFFSSNVVYYPGSGTDWQAFELFCGTHSAHCVVHIDYNVISKDVQSSLKTEHPHRIRGYEPCVQFELASSEAVKFLQLDATLCPDGQDPVVTSSLWAVLERQQGFGDEHGPKRIAFLHVQAEAVWVCRSLWRAFNPGPFAVIVQDHGYGGQRINDHSINKLGEPHPSDETFEFFGEPNRFGGANSLLYEFQLQPPQQLPKWLLVGDHTEPWPTYIEASDFAQPAGMWQNQRKLYRQG